LAIFPTTFKGAAQQIQACNDCPGVQSLRLLSCSCRHSRIMQLKNNIEVFRQQAVRLSKTGQAHCLRCCCCSNQVPRGQAFGCQLWLADICMMPLQATMCSLSSYSLPQANYRTLRYSGTIPETPVPVPYCVLCCAVLCCAVLCCAVLCCAVLCCAVLC